MCERLFRMRRKHQVVEDVEIFASSVENAIELVEDDDSTVHVMSENDGDWEVDYTSVVEIHE